MRRRWRCARLPDVLSSLSLLSTLSLLSLLSLLSVAAYSPPGDIGLPAGMLPDCPGVYKNASISAQSLPRLVVELHRRDARGALTVRTVPLASAHKTLAREKIDWSGRVVLQAVGWWDSAVWPHSRALAAGYARRGYTVLLADTFAFFTAIYPKSVRLTRVIGKKIGELLMRLTEIGLQVDQLELVGVSLGAHVASFAAAHVHAASGLRVRRLTGLDPAGPCFRALPPHMRFNKDHAEQVDVLHTNIDGFGIAEPLGHVDIYANGGEWQPGELPYVPCLVVCSHVRAVLYWWQAVLHPRRFQAMRCDSVQDARLAKCYNSTVTNYLGLEARFDRPGVFYLATSNEFPYYRGKAGLKPENEIYTSVVRAINDDDGFVI